jgi:hypothetical protein
MSYLNIISLEEAKNYLRVDIDLTEDDNQITAMIKSSLGFVEKYTNHILFDRSKEYLFDNCSQVRVYDFPINSLVTPTDATSKVKPTYSIYSTNNSSNTVLKLNVGYQNKEDIPQELIDFAYNMIELYYYQKETTDGAKIPNWMLSSIDHYKRFIF